MEKKYRGAPDRWRRSTEEHRSETERKIPGISVDDIPAPAFFTHRDLFSKSTLPPSASRRPPSPPTLTKSATADSRSSTSDLILSIALFLHRHPEALSQTAAFIFTRTLASSDDSKPVCQNGSPTSEESTPDDWSYSFTGKENPTAKGKIVQRPKKPPKTPSWRIIYRAVEFIVDNNLPWCTIYRGGVFMFPVFVLEFPAIKTCSLLC
ncbi:hypothetical protein LXL04_015305 [Taraxacum kok-saghyz]